LIHQSGHDEAAVTHSDIVSNLNYELNKI